MIIRHATYEDLPAIFPIYERARAFMAANGNPTQWTNGYPPREFLENDINEKRLYVCTENSITETPKIAMVFMFFIGVEPTYAIIKDGRWLNERPYGVIHRVASAGIIPNTADFVLDWCAGQCRSVGADLRGDTHADNLPMQHVFEKNGFARCGIVYMANGTERIAYQKELV